MTSPGESRVQGMSMWTNVVNAIGCLEVIARSLTKEHILHAKANEVFPSEVDEVMSELILATEDAQRRAYEVWKVDRT